MTGLVSMVIDWMIGPPKAELVQQIEGGRVLLLERERRIAALEADVARLEAMVADRERTVAAREAEERRLQAIVKSRETVVAAREQEIAALQGTKSNASLLSSQTPRAVTTS